LFSLAYVTGYVHGSAKLGLGGGRSWFKQWLPGKFSTLMSIVVMPHLRTFLSIVLVCLVLVVAFCYLGHLKNLLIDLYCQQLNAQ